MTYQPEDIVVHIRDGVCKVVSVAELSLTEDQTNTYYILTSVYDQNGKIYVPFDRADTCLRPLISKEEIHSLISSIPNLEMSWIADEKTRQRMMQQDMKSGSHITLLTMISTLYEKRKEIGKTGKKFHSSDERFLKEAEKLINREFGYVLGISPDDVPDYIRNEISALQ